MWIICSIFPHCWHFGQVQVAPVVVVGSVVVGKSYGEVVDGHGSGGGWHKSIFLSEQSSISSLSPI